MAWRDAKGPGGVIIGVGQDVTRLHEAQLAAERREQEFTAVFQHASDAMFILNDDWVYEQINDAACRMFGMAREEVVGRKHGTILRSTLDAMSSRRIALRQGSCSLEGEFQRGNGEIRKVELSITSNFRPGQHLMVMRDVSDKRKLQSQLTQAHRLESVGRLAGGVAHDFNNMLTAIRGYAELLQRSVSGEKHRRYVDCILGATSRAADTTQRLLAFSRKQMLKPQVVPLNEIITNIGGLLEHVIGEQVELVLLLADDAGTVKVDPAQFSQVLLNLAINARDAMLAGGKLIIETRNVDLNDEYVLKHVPVRAGRYSLMAITDTGVGIPPEIMAHIFEPFFTTKGQGKGTGLGLATVYGIVKQSAGYVWVYSEPGQGTTFKIYLPSVESRGRAEEQPSKKVVLVIEDDDSIRMSTVQTLEENGYRVLSAADGTEALAVCQQWPHQVDVVLTDVMAAGMSGEDLMGYFALKYPTVAVVHMSGFLRSRLEMQNAIGPGDAFLSKPFTVRQLLEKIEEVLQPGMANFVDSGPVRPRR
ncbi:MAG TPA: ATP-binding protein [Terriglobales bacterium]|nr:ATP-binding protein [Terriglobales bacterium]